MKTETIAGRVMNINALSEYMLPHPDRQYQANLPAVGAAYKCWCGEEGSQ